MKAFLIFPPSWTPAMPHLALPSLAAHLRPHGIEVIQRDLNLEVKDRILSRSYLTRALSVVRQIRKGQRAAGAAIPEALVAWALDEGPAVAEEVEAAKAVMRKPAFWEGQVGQNALETVVAALQLASVPFYPTSLELSTLTGAPPEFESAALFSAARDPHANIFYHLFRYGIMRDLERERPELVGISIPTAAQMLAGMTLAYLIKESGLPCHVTVGGPHITVLREQIRQLPQLFDVIDSAILFDGEVPLLRLAEAMAGDGRLADVPGTLYRQAGAVQATERGEPLPMNELPVPDFRGLPLDRYLAPGLVLPMATSRGCYHHRCAFCNVEDGLGHHFRQADPSLVVGQMAEVARSYPVQHIWFVDEAITPRNLRGMSDGLRKLGSPIDWSCYARFDRALSSELLAKMYEGGCRMLFFGLESASPRISDAMCKGIEMDEARRILRDSAGAGLWNHLFFFFGFPGETMEDAQQTVDFLYEQRPYIHSTAFGTFVLERYAPAYQRPEEYHIRSITRDPKHDLALCFNYEVDRGLTEEMAELVSSRFLDALPSKEFAHYYVHDVYRILYAKRLRDQGRPYPVWLAQDDEGTTC